MQNRNIFPTLAKVSLRYGASSMMTAALATAVLVDVGLVTEDNSSLVIDHHHIQRDRKKVMNSLSQDADTRHMNEAISCIFFDGPKNWTNVIEEDPETGKFYQSRVKMEHIVVTSEPGGEYLFHFTPAEATDQIKAAEQTTIKLFDWIKMYGVVEPLSSI